MNLTENYRLTSLKRIKKIPTGLDALVLRLSGKIKERSSIRRKMLRTARRIDRMSQELTALKESEILRALQINPSGALRQERKVSP